MNEKRFLEAHRESDCSHRGHVKFESPSGSADKVDAM